MSRRDRGRLVRCRPSTARPPVGPAEPVDVARLGCHQPGPVRAGIPVDSATLTGWPPSSASRAAAGMWMVRRGTHVVGGGGGCALPCTGTAAHVSHGLQHSLNSLLAAHGLARGPQGSKRVLSRACPRLQQQRRSLGVCSHLKNAIRWLQPCDKPGQLRWRWRQLDGAPPATPNQIAHLRCLTLHWSGTIAWWTVPACNPLLPWLGHQGRSSWAGAGQGEARCHWQQPPSPSTDFMCWSRSAPRHGAAVGWVMLQRGAVWVVRWCGSALPSLSCGAAGCEASARFVLCRRWPTAGGDTNAHSGSRALAGAACMLQ